MCRYPAVAAGCKTLDAGSIPATASKRSKGKRAPGSIWPIHPDPGCMVTRMVRELRDGVWEVIVYLGRDPDTGKRKRLSRTIQGTRDDALIHERRIKVQQHARLLRHYEAVEARQTHELLVRPIGTIVYRIYGKDPQGGDLDALLYVGVTNCIFQRIAAHLQRPGLGDAAFRVEWEQFDSRSEALAVERTLIREWRPLYNIAGAA